MAPIGMENWCFRFGDYRGHVGEMLWQRLLPVFQYKGVLEWVGWKGALR